MSKRNLKVIQFNQLLIPMLQCTSAIMDHPIKIKVTNGIGEVAKPLGIPMKGNLKGKDIWVIRLGCKGCDKEQTILFPFTTDPIMLDLLIKKIQVQQDYFKTNYCKCGCITIGS
jgi:hypothetical protein